MESSTQVFVFGDQTSLSIVDLRQLLHVNDNTFLSSFLDSANYALRVEIADLPVIKQEWFPRFTTFLDLLAESHQSGNNPALGLALQCTNQLARFIR